MWLYYIVLLSVMDCCVTVVRSRTGMLLLSGHGLVCHRAIRTICEMMGIQDLHSKVEGSSRNVKAITKGFFNSLIHQVGTYKILTRLNKISIQGTPQMAVDKEATCLSAVHSYYSTCKLPLF